MMYLTTGTNGAGKTLTTLWDVRQAQIAQNRPVFFRGFTPKQQLLDWGWQQFDADKWQDLPDASICLFDEAQEVFGTDLGKDPPQWVLDIAKYRRKRGFDFYVVTPHPMMLHTFVRRLVEKPSWHRHLKRAFGADLVSELKYGYVETQCEKPESGKNAQISMIPYRKEVYDWYQSASLHTVKKTIPRAVWVMAGVLPAFLVVGWFAVHSVLNIDKKITAKIVPSGTVEPAGAMGPARFTQSGPPQQQKAPMTAAEMADSYRPRFPGLPWTAPKYDAITQATEAPYPAACIDGIRPGKKDRECHCYTQQATLIPSTPKEMCQQIAAEGFFLEWKKPDANQAQVQQVSQAKVAAPEPAPAIIMAGTPFGNTGSGMLSSPGDNRPVFSTEPGKLVGEPTASEARSAAAVRGMRAGSRTW